MFSMIPSRTSHVASSNNIVFWGADVSVFPSFLIRCAGHAANRIAEENGDNVLFLVRVTLNNKIYRKLT